MTALIPDTPVGARADLQGELPDGDRVIDCDLCGEPTLESAACTHYASTSCSDCAATECVICRDEARTLTDVDDEPWWWRDDEHRWGWDE